MPLTPGTRLGPYEVIEPVGAGGMGEVFKARDTRLDRVVAIKVLNKIVSIDPAFRARFDREARAISALNHPFICTLHDVGADGDVAYLVMEHVDGQPLAGPLPAAQVIQIGAQICEALEAAHAAGIVHRDLKPTNILRTKSGVKLLDFGLATRSPGPAASAAALDVTMTGPLTGPHAIIGTPQYMAPEQIEGQEADARSDIFALGCVLYELVTGTRAFDGKSPSQVMAAIVAAEPRPIRELRPITPPELEWAIARCLRKDRDDRWQTARDLRAALEHVRDEPVVGAAAAPSARRRSVRTLALIAATAIAAAGLTALLLRTYQPGASLQTTPVRADVDLPAPLSAEPQTPSIALSRDARVLAYVTGLLPNTKLFVRRLDDRDGTPRLVAEGASGPFFSPDGHFIGYTDIARGKVFKLNLAGDSGPVAITDAEVLRGAVWLPDDSIIFSQTVDSPLLRVASSGGAITAVTTLDARRNEKTHRYPDVLPDGRHVLFGAGNNEINSYEDGSIFVQSLDGGPATLLVEHGMFARYSASGHLLFARGSTIYAVPFDAEKLKVTGPEVPVLSDVRTHPVYGYADLAVSATGVVVYAQGGSYTDERRMVWLDRQGAREPALSKLAVYNAGRLSPVDNRILVEVSGANNTLWLADPDRDIMQRLTFHNDAYFARWTPDGTHVTYSVRRMIRQVATDGTGKDEILIDGKDQSISPSDWSPDGKTLAFQQLVPGHGNDIMLFDRDSRRITPFAATPYAESGAQFSPDGRWLAYLSDESGRPELYLRPFGREGGRWQLSAQGAEQFAWNPRGGDIVLRQGSRFFSVRITLGDTPSFSAPIKLFDTDIPTAIALFSFGMSRDGQRMLVREPVASKPILRLALVANWFDDVRRAISGAK